MALIKAVEFASNVVLAVAFAPVCVLPGFAKIWWRCVKASFRNAVDY